MEETSADDLFWEKTWQMKIKNLKDLESQQINFDTDSEEEEKNY